MTYEVERFVNLEHGQIRQYWTGDHWSDCEYDAKEYSRIEHAIALAKTTKTRNNMWRYQVLGILRNTVKSYEEV